MPRVSVVIPSYNHAHYVTHAIDSVLQQTLKDVEIIVIDDGSTDNTRDVLLPYMDHIRYVYQDNTGLAGSRNAGMRLAQGEFINVLDSDDWFLPDKLEVQVAYLDAHPNVDIALCGWRDIEEGTGRILQSVDKLPADDMVTGILSTGNEGLIPPHSPLIRRRVIERHGMFDTSLPMREEQDYWMQLALAGCKYGMVEQVLCVYLMRATSLGKNWTKLERTMPLILKRVFDHPRLPEHIRVRKDEFYARSYVGFALKHMLASPPNWEAAQDYMARAFSHHPEALSWEKDLFDPIIYSTLLANPDDPIAVLHRLVEKVEGNPWLEHYVDSRIHLVLAFKAYEDYHYGEVLHEALAGVVADWHLLNDPRTVRIFFQSLIRLPAEALHRK